MSIPVLLSWSSGKDSAWSLYTLQQQSDYEVVGLVTTVNKKFERVAMHGVREKLLRLQAEAAELPLHILNIPSPCSNAEYEQVMLAFIETMQTKNIRHMAFGDLYLEDIRRYREQQLDGTGITPLFPLWQRPTLQLAKDMINGGIKAHLTCIDPRKLDASFAGRCFDHSLLTDLPAGIDPCGENGEFHTCVTAGPMFQHDIHTLAGDVVERDGFVFADLLPAIAGIV